LDLFKLHNQEQVYVKNIELAKQRLENINKFYTQGMITRNDVIRGELQLSNLNLALQVIQNNKAILNKQITTALGLDDQTLIIPDENVIEQANAIEDINFYRNEAQYHPIVKQTEKAIEIYKTPEKISRADMMPALSVF